MAFEFKKTPKDDRVIVVGGKKYKVSYQLSFCFARFYDPKAKECQKCKLLDKCKPLDNVRQLEKG